MLNSAEDTLSCLVGMRSNSLLTKMDSTSTRSLTPHNLKFQAVNYGK